MSDIDNYLLQMQYTMQGDHEPDTLKMMKCIERLTLAARMMGGKFTVVPHKGDVLFEYIDQNGYGTIYPEDTLHKLCELLGVEKPE